MRHDRYPLVALLGIFTVLVAHSWLAWGDVDADYGREMFVPLRLLEHDVLYRDVRYPYGPFSPYLHMLGYRLWRPHLNVLYADGIATTALLLIALYEIGRMLGGTTTATVAVLLVMLDVGFMPGGKASFSFIFPYAYPALHGLLFLSTCVAGALRLLSGQTRLAALASGTGAGLALLCKPEFGLVAVAVVAATSVGLALRERHHLTRRLLSMWIPTLLLPTLGYGLLAAATSPATIVTRGLFATDYFAGSRVIAWYIAGLSPGATWQQNTRALLDHWAMGVPLYACGLAVVGIAGVLAALLGGVSTNRRWLAPVIGLLSAAGVWIVCWVRFPPTWYAGMVGMFRGRYVLLPLLLACVLVGSGSLLVRQLAQGSRPSLPALRYAIVAVATLALLVRVPANLVPAAYANFALPLGIVLLVHLVLDRVPALPFVPAVSRAAMRAGGAGLLIGLALYVGACNWQWWLERSLEIATDRGTLRLQRDPNTLAFREALGWMDRYASPGATMISVPRGTALSFLSGHGNELYETSLIVTVATEAQERAYIAALQQTPPDLIVTSALAQPEYGLGTWGLTNHVRIRRWIQREYAVTATSNVPGYGMMTLWTRKPAARSNAG